MGRKEKCWKCDRKRSDVSLRMCDDRLCQDCDDTNRAASEGRARADHCSRDEGINSATTVTNGTTDHVNKRNDDERPRIVVNELLSFVAYKLNLMAPDTIVQLCSSFYNESEIDIAKALLYDLCADHDDRQDRMIKRSSGPRKKALSMKDIVSLFTRKHDSITVSFVAADLGKLPPIGFNNLDVWTLLSQIQATVAELDTVKANVATQAVTCFELQAAVTKQGGLCSTLNDTVSSLVAASNVVGTQPNLPEGIATGRSMAPALQPAQLPTPDASYASAVKAVTTSVVDCRTPDAEDSSGPEWQMVQARRTTAVSKPNNVARHRAPQPSQQQPTVSKPKKGVVIGKARNLTIKAAKRFANVFVARLDPNENEVTIKRHLDSTLKLDVTVELCKQSDSQSSFHLSCLCPDPSVFMSDDLWPDGTYLRWWRQPKPKSRTGSTDTTAQQGAAQVESSPDSDTATLAITPNESTAVFTPAVTIDNSAV